MSWTLARQRLKLASPGTSNFSSHSAPKYLNILLLSNFSSERPFFRRCSRPSRGAALAMQATWKILDPEAKGVGRVTDVFSIPSFRKTRLVVNLIVQEAANFHLTAFLAHEQLMQFQVHSIYCKSLWSECWGLGSTGCTTRTIGPCKQLHR